MAKLRVYQFAREYGVPSKVFLKILKDSGIEVRNKGSFVTNEAKLYFRKRYTKKRVREIARAYMDRPLPPLEGEALCEVCGERFPESDLLCIMCRDEDEVFYDLNGKEIGSTVNVCTNPKCLEVFVNEYFPRRAPSRKKKKSGLETFEDNKMLTVSEEKPMN